MCGQEDVSREDKKTLQERTNCPASNTEYNNKENNNTENQSVCQGTDGQADELFLEQIKNQSEVGIFYDDIRILFENAIE